KMGTGTASYRASPHFCFRHDVRRNEKTGDRRHGRRGRPVPSLFHYDFCFPSASLTSSSTEASMILSPGEPSHFWRITPLWSIRYSVGQPRRFHSSEMTGLPSCLSLNDRQVTLWTSFCFLSTSGSWSPLTPIRAKGLFPSVSRATAREATWPRSPLTDAPRNRERRLSPGSH